MLEFGLTWPSSMDGLAGVLAHKLCKNIFLVSHSLVQHTAAQRTSETDRWQNTHTETHTSLSSEQQVSYRGDFQCQKRQSGLKKYENKIKF